MLKKALLFLLVFSLLFCFSSCNNKSDEKQNVSSNAQKLEDESSIQTTEKTTSNNKDTNEENSEKQPSTNHNHSYTSKKTEATCKTQGYTTYSCSCGYSYKDNYENGTHKFNNNKCTYCGKLNMDNLFNFMKNWVINNGKTNGDYSRYSKSADNYGGYSNEDFSLYYWGDTDTVEFCLHSVLDDTFSINFYLLVPKNHTGNYEYISSYYYRDSGEPLYEAKGTIVASEFTNNHPLNCSKYIGSTNKQNEFMEMSRIGICDTINCLKQFLEKENMGYFLSDLGFQSFS